MDHREIAGLMAAIAPTIGDFVAKAIAPLRAENARLSSNLAAVEQRCADIQVAREQDNVIFINLIRAEIDKSEPKFDMGALDRVVTDKVGLAFSALPVPKDGKDADPEEIAQMVEQAVAKVSPTPAKDADPEVIKAAVLDIVADVLPAEVAAAVDKIEKPRDGKDGKDGKDADPVEVANLLVDLMPVPADGKDGRDGIDGKDGAAGKDADPVEVANLLVDLMPVPADGKSVTVDEVMPVLETLVAALPPAVNGKDADPETIRSMVLAEMAKIEPVNGKDGRDGIDGKDGQDGKSVAPEDVIPLIAAEVSKLELPEGKQGLPGEPGQPGASVSLPEVQGIIESLFDALPRAVNGKDADPVEVAALIVGDVAALMPVPADGKDGKSVTVDEVLPVIEQFIEQRFAAIPVPKDGVDGADVVDLLIDRGGVLVATLSNGKTKQLGPVVGKDADVAPLERMISDKLASIAAPGLDRSDVAKFVEEELARISSDSGPRDEFVPDAVASNVALAIKMMAETPQTSARQDMQPINFYSEVTLPEMKFPETVVNLTVPEQQAPVVNMAAPVVNVAPANVELPKRGKEVTTVTSWDESGRIKTFEKQEVVDK